MYAAGVASMGGDHFNNPLADQQDHQYELSSASLSAVQSGGASGDLLMGLASGLLKLDYSYSFLLRRCSQLPVNI